MATLPSSVVIYVNTKSAEYLPATAFPTERINVTFNKNEHYTGSAPLTLYGDSFLIWMHGHSTLGFTWQAMIRQSQVTWPTPR
ncbi:hypothetical protein BGZ49_004498 [Haplosporangium sp. Z 27]|nr:hypothetical protein BGZ49_004498 [Haplosporangium sp. Z 27]